MIDLKIIYRIVGFIEIGILFVFFLMISSRIITKTVLVDHFHMNSVILQSIADYTLADWMDINKEESKNLTQKTSTQLETLSGIYHEMPKTLEENIGQNQPECLSDQIYRKVESIESKLNKYCNEKVIGYYLLKRLGRNFDALMNWNVCFAQTANSEYDLKTTGYRYLVKDPEEIYSKIGRIQNEKLYADKHNIEYLYVQIPSRIDQHNEQVPIGVNEQINYFIDQKLDMMKNKDIDILDLRSQMWNKGWNPDTGFYITDGHWTTDSGFRAVGLLMQNLNERYHYNFSEQYMDSDYYQIKQYSLNNASIDEKVNFYLPKFSTKMCFYDAMRCVEYEGAFQDSCFDMDMVETDFRLNVLNAYSVSRLRNSHLAGIKNLNLTGNEGRVILVSSNSMSWFMVPYLALDLPNTYYTCDSSEKQIEYLMDKLEPDIVITIE